MLQIGASLNDDHNWQRWLKLGSSITIVSSFIIQANVITTVNYDRHLFIVQATGLSQFIHTIKFTNDVTQWKQFAYQELLAVAAIFVINNIRYFWT